MTRTVMPLGRTSILVLLVSIPSLDISSFAQTPEEHLATAMSQAAAAVRATVEQARLGSLSTRQRDVLSGRLDDIRASDLLIRARHEDMQRLLASSASGSVPARLADAAATYRQRFAPLGAALDRAQKSLDAKDTADLPGALDALARELVALLVPDERTPLGVSLPFRSLHLPPVAPSAAAAIVPAYSDAVFRQPVDADRQPSPDAPLSAEIVAQARTLGNDPIAIFEFVRNEIDIEFYYGAMKGASETLRQRRGNDIDQASLLVALMRASGVPARYVRGVASLTGEQARGWTVVSSTQRTADLFAAAGIPFRAVNQGGTVGAFEIEHTWVEIAVPYGNYRGARISPGAGNWIPLDASFKSATYARGVDVLDTPALAAGALVAEYLSTVQQLSPLDFLKLRLGEVLSGSQSPVPYPQAIGKRTLQPERLGLLPNTLPYAVVAVLEEGDSIADALRHRVRFVARTSDGVAFDVTIPTSEVVGSRVTLSYVPDSVDDQTAIDSFLGLDNTPAYLVRLRPVLRVGGVIRAAGERAAQMGASHDFSIEVQSPRITVPVENVVMAGGYYAVAFGGLRVVHDPTAAPAPDDLEEGAGDLLYTMAAGFLERWNQAESELADVMRLVLVRPVVSEVMVGTMHKRTLLFGQPQEMVWRGAFVDADLRISEVVPAVSDAHQPRGADFRQFSALAGSIAEGDVLETTLQVESVSAARLIQLARAQGVTVRDVDATNAAATLPTLATAEVVKTDLSDGVRQGWRATIPERDLVHHAWSGIGYVLHDPSDGAAGYFISGGLAGGSTAEDPAAWVQSQYKTTLSKPYAAKPNVDPSAAASIQIVPITDFQDGIVGQPLPKPLAAWVRDSLGRPVQGASVTFRVIAGGGDFDGSNTVVAHTDVLGLATALPALGKKTADAPFYTRWHPDDVHVTQVGQNLVTAAVETTSGIALTRPFEAYGFPDTPHHIVKLLGDGGEALAGTKGSTMLARVEDQHGNPVSNVPLEFLVLQQVPPAGVLPTNARNMEIVPLAPPCVNTAPVLGECGGRSELVVRTSVFGAAVDPVLGNMEKTEYRVRASITETSIAPQIFSQSSLGDRTFDVDAYRGPRLEMRVRELVNDAGGLLNAAKVGTSFKRGLETVLYLMEDDYLLDRIHETCAGPPAPPCYRILWRGTTRARPINNGLPGVVSFPSTGPGGITYVAETNLERAVVTFTVAQGGGATDLAPLNPGQGRFTTRFSVGPTPMLNIVDTTAIAHVWVPYLDLHTGSVRPMIASLRAGQHLEGFTEGQEGGPVPIVSGVATTLSHHVYGVRVTLSPPGHFSVDEEGVLTEHIELAYTIEPPNYTALQADLDVFEIDATVAADADGCHCKWTTLNVGNSKAGAGEASFLQGSRFDLGKSYRLQMTINRGSDAQLTSDKENLSFLTGFATYTSYDVLQGQGLLYPERAQALGVAPVAKKPIRGAQVWLIDPAGLVIGAGNTNDKGFYAFVPPKATGTYKVRIAAALGKFVPHLVVSNNTNSNAAYAVECSVTWNDGLSASVDAHMDSGWNSSTQQYSTTTSSPACPGVQYYGWGAGGLTTVARSSAPFAILDAIYQAEKRVQSVDPDLEFPFLNVFWSPSNTSAQPRNYPSGAIGSSSFVAPDALYVLGDADVDTDEYDAHVILHEWSHYFAFAFSRDDSVGGDHFDKEILDPRVAFSEGFANAFAGLLFKDPDPMYIDTSGRAQSLTTTVLALDLNAVTNGETVLGPSALFCLGTPPPTPCTWKLDGYYSEYSVQEVIWKLSQDLGFQWIERTIRELKTTEGFTTIFSFLHHLKRLVPALDHVIDAIGTDENIKPGDEYGDPNAKLYTEIPLGIPLAFAASGRPLQAWDRVWNPIAACDLSGSTSGCFSGSNKLYDEAFLRFTIEEPGTYTIEVAPTVGTSSFDGGNVAFRVFSGSQKQGSILVAEGDLGEAESSSFHLERGTHLITVTSFGSAARFTVRIHK